MSPAQYDLEKVVLPARVDIVVLGFLPAPHVRVMVVFPDFWRVVILGPVFVLRMVVLVMANTSL
ncbi:MAG: hypothetical protein ABSH22_09665 [Tepidisphaeraceae bacterium]|jgi:hypothetical protein